MTITKTTRSKIIIQAADNSAQLGEFHGLTIMDCLKELKASRQTFSPDAQVIASYAFFPVKMMRMDEFVLKYSEALAAA